MKKTKRFIIIILLIGLMGVITYFLGMRTGRIAAKPTITSTIVEEQLQSVKELTTLKYKYTNVGAFENQSEFYGIKIPLTLKKFIVSYDGVINAGVVLDNADITVSGNTINISLPPSQILSHEIDEDSLQIFDEQNSIFNQLQIEDYSAFRKDQKQKTESKVIEEGILVEAMKNTKIAIEELLNINPEISNEYNIVIIEK